MVDITKKRLEVSRLLSEVNEGIIDEYEFDCIKQSIYKKVNYVYRDATYLYLTKVEDFLKAVKKNHYRLVDIKDNLLFYAENQMFLAMTSTIMQPLNEMNREELIEAYKEKYNSLKERLSFFNGGYNILADINRSFFGMTKTEMTEFLKKNDVKSSMGYLDYMSDSLIKYYTTLLEYVTDEVDKKISDYKKDDGDCSGKHYFGNTYCITDVCEKMYNLYLSKHDVTPLEDIESNAFSQISMVEVYPDRNNGNTSRKR